MVMGAATSSLYLRDHILVRFSEGIWSNLERELVRLCMGTMLSAIFFDFLVACLTGDLLIFLDWAVITEVRRQSLSIWVTSSSQP